MRQPTRQPQVKLLKQALQIVFRGIFYRHEFARRNDDVRKESADLLKQLDMPPDRANHFLAEDGKSMLTDEIMANFKKTTPANQRKMKQALRRFFQKSKILPMTGDLTAGDTTLEVESIKDMPGFANALKSPFDPMSTFLRQHLSAATRQAIDSYKGSASNPGQLTIVLVQELNKIIQDYPLVEHRVAIIRGITARLLQQNPQGNAAIRLNRMLLEDAYPQYLITTSTRPFFPDECRPQEQINLKQLVIIWNALLKFELFCVTHIENGSPVFLPMLSIGMATSPTIDPKQLINLGQRLDLSTSRFSLLTSLEMPDELMQAYIDVFRFQESLSRHFIKTDSEPDYYRIPWDHFDWALRVYDFSLARPCSMTCIPAYKDFLKTEARRGFGPKEKKKNGKNKRRISNKAKLHNQENTYYNYLNLAEEWIKQYPHII